MGCNWFRGPDGVLVHVKTSGATRFRTCEFCGRPKSAGLLCDGAMDWRKNPRRSKTCDAAMCTSCATEIRDNFHLCPRCKAEAGATRTRHALLMLNRHPAEIAAAAAKTLLPLSLEERLVVLGFLTAAAETALAEQRERADQLLTTAEAAALSGCTLSAVYTAVSRGRLQPHKQVRVTYFRRKDVIAAGLKGKR